MMVPAVAARARKVTLRDLPVPTPVKIGARVSTFQLSAPGLLTTVFRALVPAYCRLGSREKEALPEPLLELVHPVTPFSNPPFVTRFWAWSSPVPITNNTAPIM